MKFSISCLRITIKNYVIDFTQCYHVDSLPASICFILSCRAVSSHIPNAWYKLLYVASIPFFCFHFLSIAIFLAGTECVDSSIAISSASVSPRKGEISRQSIIDRLITARCMSIHCSFQSGTACCVPIHDAMLGKGKKTRARR